MIEVRNDVLLLKHLLADAPVRAAFFTDVDGVQVFDSNRFVQFVNNKAFLPDSYTAFKNKIGIAEGDEFISEKKEVVLNWPYKDCVLEGGQTKEDAKRDEVFWNETLAPDQIHRLLDPKVFTNWKRIDAKGEHKLDGLTVNAAGDLQDNLIIKGNNLLALHSLKSRFAGKVKLIYIDPPYNTEGDGFRYNDSFNHSTWLTFMRNRLEAAKPFLRNDGLMFVHCDDVEFAYLKVLLDEIFGRDNFVATLIHQRAKGGGNAKHIVKGHDYVNIYAKNLTADLKIVRDKVVQSKVVEIDGVSYVRNDDVVRKVFGKYDKSLGDRRCFYEELGEYKSPKQIQEIEAKIKSGEYVLEKASNGKRVICTYTKTGESHSKLYSIVKALSEDGTDELSALGLDFKNPKPEAILKFLIASATQEGDIVLDFFAGSGTTCAVAHKMGRQYIGIEQMDYIHDLPEARLRKVIAGEQGGISEEVGWKGGGDFVYAELLPLNQIFKEKVERAKNEKELAKVWSEIQEKGFLSYKIDFKKFDAKAFTDLSLADQKRFILEHLSYNYLYVNKSEIEDIDYKITPEDKKLNKEFYAR